MALAVVAALLGSLSAFAAAPPPLPADPVVPGPPGLFEVPEFQTDPVRMSLAVIGAGASPTGAWASAATVYAGEHPRVNAWKLDGPMTNLYSRRAVGTSTVFLAGFCGSPAGIGALTQLATLKAGDNFYCWALRDTDRFHPLPKEWLGAFTDGTGIATGGFEAEIYSKVLERVNYTSAAAFKSAVRSDITYSHVANDPDDYRGEVMHVEGRLGKVNRHKPPFEAAQKGVNDLYEAWVFSEYLGSNPYVVIFTEWPAGLPRELLGQELLSKDKNHPVYRVAMDGYFIKKFRYQARDGKKTERDAPMLMGHSLIFLQQNGVSTGESTAWLNHMVYGIVGIFGVVFAAVVGLTWWFRRADQRVRRRILAMHTSEFVLPPPDALPVAAPVAAPAHRSAGGRPLTPRIVLPASAGQRRIEPPSAGEGGNRGSPDKPPDEDAGV
jgi:hypothetical protein